MRILVDGITLQGQRTGIGWYTHRLLRALAAREDLSELGVAIGARVIRWREMPDRPAAAATRGGHFLRRCLSALPLAREAVLHARSLRLRRRCDNWTLFHQPNYVSPWLPLPLVTTVCDLSHVACPQWMPRGRRDLLLRSLQNDLERSRAIITISRFTRDELLAHFPSLDPQRVFVTPLGVDQERFFPAPVEPELFARWRLPPRFVLYLGTLEPRKNLQGLLKAYARLPHALKREFPLVLAGVAGWRRGYFQAQLQQLVDAGVVRQLGYVAQDDVPALMRAATVFAFPSFYEGFGLPVLEAAACGAPVLCARAASLPEVMGEAAVYVDPAQPEDIAENLARLLADQSLQARLSAAGRERSREFSWENCAAETMRAYRAAA